MHFGFLRVIQLMMVKTLYDQVILGLLKFQHYPLKLLGHLWFRFGGRSVQNKVLTI